MREIWKMKAMNDLEMYEARKTAIENISEQLRELEAEMTSIRSPGAENNSGRGGESRKDNRYINNIVSRDLLKENLKEAKRNVRRVERAMKVLTDEEKDILKLFFIKREKEAAFDLADKLRIDRKTVYYRRDLALEKFTIAMYNGL
jgi:hypothetical protein